MRVRTDTRHVTQATSWLVYSLDPTKRERFIGKIAENIEKTKLKFDAIAFRGLSGALVAPGVASRLGVGLCAVRKMDEQRHSRNLVEGFAGAKRTGFNDPDEPYRMADDPDSPRYVFKYVILDDLTASGTTVREIAEAMDEERPESRLVSVMTYLEEIWNKKFTLRLGDYDSRVRSDFVGESWYEFFRQG